MNIFIDNINMETQTVFKKDGCIDIYPCDFEQGQHIVSHERQAQQRGRMTTDDDGTSHFTPYASSTGHRYEIIRQVKNGKFMMSDGRLVLRISVPLRNRNAYEDLLNTVLECTRPTPEVIRKINSRLQ